MLINILIFVLYKSVEKLFICYEGSHKKLVLSRKYLYLNNTIIALFAKEE